jgi:acetyl-CoA carboxylase biotin carboxylase subunit
VRDAAAAKAFTDEVGFPVIIKAAHGGGGRGMRVVTEAGQIESQFQLASSEALAA